MSSPDFAERLAYARLLRHFRTGEAPGNAEIGRAVGRSGPWVTKWAQLHDPPRDYTVHAPLAAFLGVEERWLIRGQGSAPDPELWNRWREMRDGDSVHEEPAPPQKQQRRFPIAAKVIPEKKPAVKNAVGEGKGRRGA